jgi:hypothetical protein
MIILAVLMVMASLFLWSAQPTSAHLEQQTTVTIKTHASQGDVVEVEGGSSTLTTTSEGASVVLNTAQLEPGNVHTIWWVIINNPEACSTSPCTAQDILANTEAVDAEITYGGGQIADENGLAAFSAELAAGDVPNPWYGNGFNNPLGAEIHIVINDHGPEIPELSDNMLNTYRGGCTDESLPGAFPDTAKADGEPGPNTCRLVQNAIFQQASTELTATDKALLKSFLGWLGQLDAGCS